MISIDMFMLIASVLLLSGILFLLINYDHGNHF